MSDSDDTDVLVLIPPDLFLIDSNRVEDLIETQGDKNAIEIKKTEDLKISKNLQENFISNCAAIILDKNQDKNCPFCQSCCCYSSCSIASMSSSYISQKNPNITNNYNGQNQPLESFNINGDRYRYPTEESELETINEKISQIEKNYSISSEISSISNCTAISLFQSDDLNKDEKTNWNTTSNSELKKPRKIHSTPKTDKTVLENRSAAYRNSLSRIVKKYSVKEDKNDVFNEINQFLENKEKVFRKSKEEMVTIHDDPEEEGLSTPATYRVVVDGNDRVICSQELSIDNGNRLSDVSEDEEQLISLSKMWEGDNKPNYKLALQEERLRRQHCEKTIQALQTKLLEYQQRISIAIEVDKRKDIQLNKQKQENIEFKKKLLGIENEMHEFEDLKHSYVAQLYEENKEIEERTKVLERELADALDLVRKSEEKNEILQAKIASYSKVSSEDVSLYKQQLDDLQELVSKAKSEERLAKDEIVKMNSLLVKIEVHTNKTVEENNKFKKEVQQLQNKLNVLKEDKNNIIGKIKEEKGKVFVLEKRNKDLQDSITVISKREKQILKEYEQQKSSLKIHYQEQLEAAVDQKVKEFQAQLDSAEEFLRSEGKQREKLIAERAFQQLTIIKEKSDKELQLVHEKHNEEIKLYRLQLMNAAKKVKEIQGQLELLKSGRVQVAEKLYHIMETQWKKALEILTTPNVEISDPSKIPKSNAKVQERLDDASLRKKNSSYKLAEKEEAPSTYRIPNKKKDENRKEIDRLQTYIEMLLDTSPRDIDIIDEILLLPKKILGETSNSNFKPPWK